MEEKATKRGWHPGGETTVVEGEREEEALDAKLWGRLQEYIPLHIVYEKLPLEDRARLCVVCKAWNRSALQRLEPKPYFVVISEGYSESSAVYLNGLLKYDVESGELGLERQPFRLYQRGGNLDVVHGALRVLLFEVEGLILCQSIQDDMEHLGVYSSHTKRWHTVPLAPPETRKSDTKCGMMVDTSERPYTFKLVVGSVGQKTHIYDSRSRIWSSTSSTLLRSAISVLDYCWVYSCMCHDGCVYMSIGNTYEQVILVYSMKEDTWGTLDFPPVNLDNHNTLGVWEGRIFTIRMCRSNMCIVVWELIDLKKQEWAEYGRCSEEEYNQLVLYDFDNSESLAFEGLQTLEFVFCDEYLLIYNWLYCRGEVFLMFNLKTKKWTPVGLPKGFTLSTEVERDDYFWDDSELELDDEDDFDWVDDVDELSESEVYEVDGSDGDFEDDVEDDEDEG